MVDTAQVMIMCVMQVMRAYGLLVCVLFVSSAADIVFIPSASAITDQSQSAKYLYQYFKSLHYVDDPGHRKPVCILPNGLSKPGERAHDRNKFLPLVGFEPHSLD